MIVTLIEKVYNFLWGDLITLPLPGGGSVGLSLRISRDLQGKGIDRDLIDRCLAEEYEVSETDQIRELLRRKGYDQGARDRKQQDKMYRFLMQRGYRSEDIRRALWREDF